MCVLTLARSTGPVGLEVYGEQSQRIRDAFGSPEAGRCC
jgi:hypothetical protein